LFSKYFSLGFFQVGHEFFFAQAALFDFLPQVARKIVKGGFLPLPRYEPFVFCHREQDCHGCAATLNDSVLVTLTNLPNDCAEIAPYFSCRDYSLATHYLALSNKRDMLTEDTLPQVTRKW
jgi:hypothetical protein